MAYGLDEIREALDAWYEACASEHQEKMLRDYFSNESPENIPADLRAASVIFRGSVSLGRESLPESLDVPHFRRQHSVFYALAAVAAAIAAVVVISVKRPFYGYDYDGSRITSQAKVMESAEYLDCLALLDEDISMINDVLN